MRRVVFLGAFLMQATVACLLAVQDFSNRDLSNKSYSSQDLHGANFSGSNLQGCDLR